jgi:hypothetical protein
MKKQKLTTVIDLARVHKWVSDINPYFMTVCPQEFFEGMGFPTDIIRKYIRRHRHLLLNDGTTGNASGVSDYDILVMLANNISANTSKGDKLLCTSNRIQAYRDACLARLDEIESQKN